MRQVLLSLVKILKSQGVDMPFLQSQVVDATLPNLILRGTRSQVKASMMAIDIFIRKQAILPAELISLIGNWLVNNHIRWTSLLQDDCEALSIDISRFVNRSVDNSTESSWAREVASKIFVLGFVSWGRHLDTASTAGSALTAFIENLQPSSCPGQNAQNLSSTWVAPVRHVVLQNMDALETMSNQILHGLFKTDPHGFNCFINTLPLTGILNSDMADAPLEELILLFGALQIGKKIGLVHEDCMFCSLYNPEFLGDLLTLK